MSKKSPWFNHALLLTTALVAPAIASAQEAPAGSASQPAEQSAPPSNDGPEITVRGRFIPEPMRQTSEVASFLSAEDLARQGDDDAAAALTRLTGLSVNKGFVYVRGLGDRYSSALLNGSPLPSPEPLRRQVPLDLFPTNILDGATVQKTFSPNYPGEFGGGIIDLRTVKFPNEPFFTAKVSTGGNTESTGKKGFTYYGESNDWTGVSDSVREVPAALAAALSRGDLINSQDGNFTDEELETIGESLVNSNLFVVQEQKLDPDFEGEVTAGTSIDVGKYNIGLVAVAGYDSSWRTQSATRNRAPEGRGVPTQFPQNSTSTDWNIVANALAGATLGWGANEISLTGLVIRSTTKNAQVLFETDINTSVDAFRRESTAWYESQLGSLLVNGKHEFGDLKVDWRGSFARSTRDAPFEREYTQALNFTFGTASFFPSSQNNVIRFSTLRDEVASGGVDFEYPFTLAGRDITLTAGISSSDTDRVYTQEQFSFDLIGGTLPTDVATARVDFLFSPDNIDPNRFVIRENTGKDDSYKGNLKVDAVYASLDGDVTSFIKAAVGVRFEDGSQEVQTFNRFGQTPTAPASIEEQYVLPAATVTWNFADDLQLRLGYSQTIARPQFRELAFTPYIDPDTDRIYTGNPFLKDSEFKNYDARLEYYFGRNQFVTVGAFYKQIDNPIEEVAILSGGRSNTRFINAPEAELTGAEFEYRANFELPLPFLEDATWLFAINYTYTDSVVNAPAGSTVIDPTQLPAKVTVPSSQLLKDGSALQGAPDGIANLQFGYQTVNSQLTLLAGWLDERVLQRGLGNFPSVVERSGVNLDLVYRREFRIGASDFTLGLSGRNLLDEQHEEFQRSTAGETKYNTYDLGRTFSISLTAKY